MYHYCKNVLDFYNNKKNRKKKIYYPIIIEIKKTFLLTALINESIVHSEALEESFILNQLPLYDGRLLHLIEN